ncbi:cadherin repeat domain-containing protein [Winogradskyella helgolandensis]|uniref:cadherin repeat domain-containing protein n=1 Tax=Winogradskyella helgolandensis TaxID=2697010 RepID=UPI0015C8E20E|nr:cadherin repeat domain-containing protein [Winogradskyella helgolandensis]
MKNIFLNLLIVVLLISCNANESQTEIEVTSADFFLQTDENPNTNQFLGTIEGSTTEGEVQFSLEEEAPTGAFLINENTGELTVRDASLFNYEVNPILTGTVKVYNGDIAVFSAIEVTLNDLVETTDFVITLDENPNSNQLLGIIEVSINEGEVQFSLEEETPTGAFLINENTGELTVGDASLFDYEVNPILTGTVKVYTDDIAVFSAIEVTLNDLDEIVITVEATDFELSVNEDIPNNEVLGIVQANTNHGELTFSIQEQYPVNAFSVDASTGELKVKNSNLFNYETYPIISGIINVTNDDVSASAAVTINLLDVTYDNSIFKGSSSTVTSGANLNLDITNQNVVIHYENTQFSYLYYYLGLYNGDIRFYETNNNLITNFTEQDMFYGSGCRGNFTLTYDSSDRITNIQVDITLCGPESLNYNIEYIGNTVNFIDQINSDDRSMVLNDNDQILSYTVGTSTVDFVYDSNNNLINISSGNGSITYEYDDYQNPYKFDETLNLSFVQYFVYVLTNGFFDNSNRLNNIFNNTNNITRIVRTNVQFPIDVNYSYNYNSNNYPISKTSNVYDGSVQYYYFD